MASSASSGKRAPTTGFDGVKGDQTAKRIKFLKKNQPSGKWRKIRKIKVEYTLINQIWKYQSKNFIRKVVIPWGMTKHMTKILQDSKVKRKQVIPSEVKEALSLEDGNFDIDDIEVSCSNIGNLGFEEFYFLFCEKCETKKIPEFTGMIRLTIFLLSSLSVCV